MPGSNGFNDDEQYDEGDYEEEDAADEAFRSIVIGAMSSSTMKRFCAAATMLIAGKRGRDMQAPEPLVEVGFEISEAQMASFVASAEESGRDLIHVGCHPDGSGKPTGMIAVVYFEDGKARPHRRCGLVCAPGSRRVLLAGVSDVEDETCYFEFAPGEKMRRVPGYPLENLPDHLNRAGELWFKRADAPDLADCDDEPVRVPGLIQAGMEVGDLGAA